MTVRVTEELALTNYNSPYTSNNQRLHFTIFSWWINMHAVNNECKMTRWGTVHSSPQLWIQAPELG